MINILHLLLIIYFQLPKTGKSINWSPLTKHCIPWLSHSIMYSVSTRGTCVQGTLLWRRTRVDWGWCQVRRDITRAASTVLSSFIHSTWQRTPDQEWNVNMEHSTPRDHDIDCIGQLHQIDGITLHGNTHILHISNIIFHSINLLLGCR